MLVKYTQSEVIFPPPFLKEIQWQGFEFVEATGIGFTAVDRDHNISAITYSLDVGKVEFQLEGPLTTTLVDSEAPYTLIPESGSPSDLPSGLYDLRVIIFDTQNQPSDTAEVSFLVVHSEVEQELSFLAYPNRSADRVKFRTSLSEQNTAQLEIYDLQGNLIYRQKFKGDLETEVDLSKFGKGLYIARIKDGDKVMTRRILID